MRLPCRSEWIDSSVLFLEFHILFAGHQPVIDPRESNGLQQRIAQRSAPILLILSDGCFLLRSGAQEDVVQSISILDSEDMRQDGVIEDVLSHVRRLHEGSDAVRMNMLCRTNARQHQQRRHLKHAARHDHFVPRLECHFPVNVDHRHAGCNRAVEVDLLGLRVGQDVDVRFAFDEDPTRRPYSFVYRIDAFEQPVDFAFVDVVGQLLPFTEPRLLQSLPETGQLRQEVANGDIEGPLFADVVKVRGGDIVVVVVCGWLDEEVSYITSKIHPSIHRHTYLAEIALAVSPVPGLTPVLLPIVVRGLAASHSGMIMGAAATTEHFASGVGLFDSLVIRAIDQRRLKCPVVRTAAQFKRTSGSGDFRHIFRVAKGTSVS